MAFALNPKVVQSSAGGVPEIAWTWEEANSMSFTAGEVVYYDTSVGTNHAVKVIADDATLIDGIAQKAATNVTSANTEIPVELMYPEDRLKVYTINNTAATTCESYVHGLRYGWYVASNRHYCDLNDTTNDALIFKDYLYTGAGAYSVWGIFKAVSTTVGHYAGA